MKLITEMVEDVEYITEDNSAGGKSLFIKGPFLQTEQPNRNRRQYPFGIMEREVKRYMAEKIDKKGAFGELGHPEGPTINLDRVSHIITELYQDGNDFIGKAKIMETPMGNIAKSIMEGGGRLGVSSRGMGSLKESRNGISIVGDDFHLATAADIVADPSAPDAYVDGIMEGRDWVWNNGIIQESVIAGHHKAIKNATKISLEEVKLDKWAQFLRKL